MQRTDTRQLASKLAAAEASGYNAGAPPGGAPPQGGGYPPQLQAGRPGGAVCHHAAQSPPVSDFFLAWTSFLRAIPRCECCKAFLPSSFLCVTSDASTIEYVIFLPFSDILFLFILTLMAYKQPYQSYPGSSSSQGSYQPYSQSQQPTYQQNYQQPPYGQQPSYNPQKPYDQPSYIQQPPYNQSFYGNQNSAPPIPPRLQPGAPQYQAYGQPSHSPVPPQLPYSTKPGVGYVCS